MHEGGGGGGGGAKRTPESISARLGQQIGVCTKKFSAMEPLSISWALALGMGVAPVVIGNASPSIWAWSSVRKNTMFGLLGLLSVLVFLLPSSAAICFSRAEIVCSSRASCALLCASCALICASCGLSWESSALSSVPLRARHGGAKSAHDRAAASITGPQHFDFHESVDARAPVPVIPSTRDSQPEAASPQ